MGTSNGRVIGTTKLVDHGPDDEKWCLVITGDGFTSAEMGAFETVVDDFAVYLEANLTGTANWDKVNVIRMDVESDESGADGVGCDAAIAVDTYFDAAVCVSGSTAPSKSTSRSPLMQRMPTSPSGMPCSSSST
jgi:hypothetical protein